MELARHIRRTRLGAAAVAVALLAVVTVAIQGGASAASRPTVVPLPDGFQPEGIATRDGNTFFVGSIPTGAVYKGSLRTGEGSLLVPEQSGRRAIGLSLHRDMLFVAGGPTGQAYVYDAGSGAELAFFQLTTDPTFVNDVVVTEDAAYFTDSVNPRLYRIPLNDGGFGAPQMVPLSGDLVYQPGFNVNGIDATPNGKTLVVVQSNTGGLFTVDPATGVASTIDLGGETVTNGDGILLDGKRLWVLQNFDNLLTKVRVAPDLGSGEIVSRSSHASFDVPTTLARAGDRLAIVNARFGNASPESAEYWVTQLRRPR